jgi:hypothetical protein
LQHLNLSVGGLLDAVGQAASFHRLMKQSQPDGLGDSLRARRRR